jgi:DNA-dependent protein kinase catalytic subunit
MSIARRKLQRENPALILVDELQTGNAGRKPWFEMVKSAVMGSDGSQRAGVGPYCKDWSEQVDVLVEIATDPGILGRSWTGWAPWS